MAASTAIPLKPDEMPLPMGVQAETGALLAGTAELADAQHQRQALPGQVPDPILANRWVARDDARNYVTLGDPAVRLRVENMPA